MTEDEVLDMFVKDGLNNLQPLDSASRSLAQYVANNHTLWPYGATALLISVGAQLIRHRIDEWWNSSSVDTLAAKVLDMATSRCALSLTRSEVAAERQIIHLHEIQTMIGTSQAQHHECSGLVFDPPRRQEPDDSGCNWEINPMPTGDTSFGMQACDCYFAMEDDFRVLRSRFNMSGDPAATIGSGSENRVGLCGQEYLVLIKSDGETPSGLTSVPVADPTS